MLCVEEDQMQVVKEGGGGSEMTCIQSSLDEFKAHRFWDHLVVVGKSGAIGQCLELFRDRALVTTLVNGVTPGSMYSA